MSRPEAVLGILSLIVWSIVAVICIKYLSIVLRADNRGEGGVLALSTLVSALDLPRGRRAILYLGMLGAALFFADGAITPAITVLSAVEGLSVNHVDSPRHLVIIALLIIAVLFAAQPRGTERIGRSFGPIMVIWFLALAALGIRMIVQVPTILRALNPVHALRFLESHSSVALPVLGAVFLAVTGGEALFADLGHFGRTPIRLAWYCLVLPALILNYLGQGALVLANPAAAVKPFFMLVPEPLLGGMVVLAAVASVIASQAVISGVFSVSYQAIRLGRLPRLEVRHSSEQTMGQVYLPFFNLLLWLATSALVIGFASSNALAGAYGIAISLAMLIDAVLVMLWLWAGRIRWASIILPVMLAALLIDAMFVMANAGKLSGGGWVPLALAAAAFAAMLSWTRGVAVLRKQLQRDEHSVRELQQELLRAKPALIDGTAIYLSASARGVPRSLWRNIEQFGAIHRNVILLTIVTEESPRVDDRRRMEITHLLPGITRITSHYGFMERPTVADIVYAAERQGVSCDLASSVYFVGVTSVAFGRSGMSGWQKRLFAFMLRNARHATAFYGVPDRNLLEIGSRVRI